MSVRASATVLLIVVLMRQMLSSAAGFVRPGTRAARFSAQALVALLLSASLPAQATIVYSPAVTVREFFILSEYGGGDVGFIASGPTTGCAQGFWLRPSDPGFKSLYAALMLAYTTKAPIRVAALDDSIWSGSVGTYCRVYYINFDPN